MFFHQRFIPGLAIASYMVADEKTGHAAVIDPTRDVDEFVEIARREGFHIRHVFETHVHADFVSGSVQMKHAVPEVMIHCSGMGGAPWTPPYADHVLKHGDEISLGSLRLRAMHTPGHTYEHMTYALFDDTRSKLTPWLLLTGDFIFVGDVGRPDLLGEEAQRLLAHQLYESVFHRLTDLADFTEVYPAHGAGSLCGKALSSRRSSTLGFERRFNPSMQPADEKEWTANLLRGMPLAPPYFRWMKKINAEGPAIASPSILPAQRRFSCKEIFGRACGDCLILDVRSKEAFAAAHIPGAINIPLGPNLPTWAGWVLPYDRPIVIVPNQANDVPEVITHLLRVGLDDILGYLEDGMDVWENSSYPLSSLRTLPATELARQLRQGATRQLVLDVRTDSEWQNGHIESAQHIHGGLLRERIGEIPKEREIVIICGTGYRGSIAASYLQHEGFGHVTNVLGGMMAWKAAGLEVVSRG